MHMQLQASGWGAVDGIEFICVTAPHACEPKPELYEAFVARGLYSKSKYYSWGFDNAKATAASVARVQQLLLTYVVHVCSSRC